MSHFNASFLVRKRQFRSLSGVTPDIFEDMVRRIEPLWDRSARRKNRSGRPYGVGGVADHLLVLLILYRCHITQDFLGMLYGVDKATICRSLRRIEKLAQHVLGVRRTITISEDEAQALLIDATEQRIQRPKKGQKRWYSGKKKCHTIKNEIIVTYAGRIVAVSKSAPGTMHDLTIRKHGPPLPKNVRAFADSGYQGYQNEHPNLEIPYKTSKKQQLEPDQKEYNHALARKTRFRILADRFRYPRHTHYTKFSIIAGIVNIIAGF